MLHSYQVKRALLVIQITMASFLRTSVLVLLFWPFACSTDNQAPGVLELRSLTTEIIIPVGMDDAPCLESCPEIIYTLSNNSDKKLFLYNFRRNFLLAYREDELACDTIWNGKQIYLFNKDSTFVAPTLGLHDSVSSYSDILRQTDMAKTWYRNAGIVIDKGKSYEFKQKIDFKNYHLRSGTYFFFLGYRQVGIPPEITPDEVAVDIGDASLFGGCLRSDFVKLIVGIPQDSASLLLEQIEVSGKR